MSREFSIGRLATAAGVNVETIRYYQRRGLLPEPRKPALGYRRYPIEVVHRLRFIKRAQALGFTLEEIRSLLELEDAGVCEEVREVAANKLNLISEKLRDLQAMQRALAELLQQCDAGTSAGGCPIIQVLSHDEQIEPLPMPTE